MAEDGLTAGRGSGPQSGLHTLAGVVAREDEPLLAEDHHPGAPAEGLPVPGQLDPAVWRRLRPGTEHLYTGGGLPLPLPLPALPHSLPHQGQPGPAGISAFLSYREMLQGGN